MKKELLNHVNALVLQVLYRSLRVLYKHDSRVREEIDSWDKNISFKLVCGPGGAVLALRSCENVGFRKLPRAQRADITMRFKSVEGAFRVLSGQKSIADAYAEHLFMLEGDIYKTMGFVRCLEFAEAYLFPRIWSGRILKEIPDKQLATLKVYALAMLENG